MSPEQNLFEQTPKIEDGSTGLTREFRSWPELRGILDQLTNWVPRPILTGVVGLAVDMMDMYNADPLKHGRLAYITRGGSSEKPKEIELQYVPLGTARTLDQQIRMGLAPENPSFENITTCLEINPFETNKILARKWAKHLPTPGLNSSQSKR